MPGTLLIGSPKTSWRDWLRQNRAGRDLLCLDPSDSALGTPARAALYREDRAIAWRFYGSLYASRAPHVLLGALQQLLSQAEADVLVQLFAYRPSPLLRQTAMLMAEAARPDAILIAQEAELDLNGWPVGPEIVELEKALPATVEAAQRRAQWLKLFQECEDHELELRSLTIEGARLGSGRMLGEADLQRAGLEGVLWAEACGVTLLIVSEEELADSQVSRALDSTGCSKAQIVAPKAYEDRICSFAREGGEDFGMGAIREADFERGTFRVRCTAVAPTPVRVLRIGGLKVSEDGVEQGEAKPWEI